MARTQTMVQLTDDLVAELDRAAERAGKSRSALIREAIVEHLRQRSRSEQIDRYVEGYRRQPPATPDDWGDLGSEVDVHGHDLARRLDQEERDAGLSW